ncbi:Peptidoglycan-recognition protein LC [Temnothorax longispinosus]|uniref:Peptidoglycan-recognition protein LC n=1 Tax=Temnothorax longispinosus TaxID=300112 RepID=A0A4S2KJD9_9HYME|nr:Peptidoglycan-recognition protein LC [Temnothorax longispinosus]
MRASIGGRLPLLVPAEVRKPHAKRSVVPPKLQLRAAQKIIELGVKAGKIAPDYKLLGHRQVSNTVSPRDALYNEIIKWPHWSSEP